MNRMLHAVSLASIQLEFTTEARRHGEILRFVLLFSVPPCLRGRFRFDVDHKIKN